MRQQHNEFQAVKTQMQTQLSQLQAEYQNLKQHIAQLQVMMYSYVNVNGCIHECVNARIRMGTCKYNFPMYARMHIRVYIHIPVYAYSNGNNEFRV